MASAATQTTKRYVALALLHGRDGLSAVSHAVGISILPLLAGHAMNHCRQCVHYRWRVDSRHEKVLIHGTVAMAVAIAVAMQWQWQLGPAAVARQAGNGGASSSRAGQQL